MITYLLTTLFRMMLNQSMPWNMAEVDKGILFFVMMFETYVEGAFTIGCIVCRDKGK